LKPRSGRTATAAPASGRDVQPFMTTLNEFSRCVAQYDPHALPVSAAQAIVRHWATPVTAVERVPLRDALDRVLAADIVSPIDVPSHDNSAMDGYAFNGAALATSESAVDLTIVGKALAGHPFTGHVDTTQCVRVMTGACMPAGCDTVVPQELVERSTDSTSIRFAANALRGGANRRLAGEDLARGHAALRLALAKSAYGGACASHFSPRATSCVRSANRSTRVRCTTAIATRCSRCSGA
jgi:molybdopterin molybdotransferase